MAEPLIRGRNLGARRARRRDRLAPVAGGAEQRERGRERRERRQCERHSGGRGHDLAAAREAEKERPPVADERRDPGQNTADLARERDADERDPATGVDEEADARAAKPAPPGSTATGELGGGT
jgi:hypothetical protein